MRQLQLVLYAHRHLPDTLQHLHPKLRQVVTLHNPAVLQQHHPHLLVNTPQCYTRMRNRIQQLYLSNLELRVHWLTWADLSLIRLNTYHNCNKCRRSMIATHSRLDILLFMRRKLPHHLPQQRCILLADHKHSLRAREASRHHYRRLSTVIFSDRLRCLDRFHQRRALRLRLRLLLGRACASEV